jgi:hypothetical protein
MPGPAMNNKLEYNVVGRFSLSAILNLHLRPVKPLQTLAYRNRHPAMPPFSKMKSRRPLSAVESYPCLSGSDRKVSTTTSARSCLLSSELGLLSSEMIGRLVVVIDGGASWAPSASSSGNCEPGPGAIMSRAASAELAALSALSGRAGSGSGRRVPAASCSACGLCRLVSEPRARRLAVGTS